MKTVKLGDVFEPVKGNASSFEDYHEVRGQPSGDERVVAYVSASTNNNGVNGYVIPNQKDTVHDEGRIVVASQGDGSVCFATVQLAAFISSKQSWVLVEKPDWVGRISAERKFWLCAFIRKNHWRFSFGRNVSSTRLQDLDVPEHWLVDKLPAL